MYLGTILKCPKPDEARCCGVSVEVVVGSTTDKVTPMELEVITTASPSDTDELTTISNESDIITESNDQIQSSSYDNEIDTTTSYETTDANEEQTMPPTIQAENIHGRSKGDDIFRIYPSESVDEASPSYVKMINHSPAMLVFASKDPSLNPGANVEFNAVTTTEETVEFKIDEATERTIQAIPIEETAELEFIDKTDNIETQEPDEIVPEVDLNVLNEASEGSELNVIDEATESVPDVITTPGTETDITVPDLISTIEVDNQIELSNNKRRQTTPANIEEPMPTLSNEKVSNKLVTVPAIVNETLNHKFIPRKFDVLGKSNGVIGTVLDSEHKNQIVEVQSILSTISKQMIDEKPKIIRSDSLQELIAMNQKIFRPSLGRKRNNHVQKTRVELAVTTEQTIETTTQAEVSKRKFIRRQPVRRFGGSSTAKPKTSSNSIITTKTTTVSPNEHEKENTMPRNRYSRRRLPIKSIAKTEPITAAPAPARVNPVIKSNEQSQTSEPPTRVMVEKRKQLFASRQRGSWGRVTATTENIDQSSSTTEKMTEKPIRNAFDFKKAPHRFNPKLNRSTESTPIIDENDS